MPFSYGTRTRQYIDVSDSDENDRIIVALEDGCVVCLKKGAGRRDLEVDRDQTHQTILEQQYQHVLKDVSRTDRYSWDGPFGWFHHWWWLRTRTVPTIKQVREQACLEVSIVADRDAFDDSPRVGERLCIMSTFPGMGGGGFVTSSPISAVQFTTF